MGAFYAGVIDLASGLWGSAYQQQKLIISVIALFTGVLHLGGSGRPVRRVLSALFFSILLLPVMLFIAAVVPNSGLIRRYGAHFLGICILAFYGAVFGKGDRYARLAVICVIASASVHLDFIPYKLLLGGGLIPGGDAFLYALCVVIYIAAMAGVSLFIRRFDISGFESVPYSNVTSIAAVSPFSVTIRYTLNVAAQPGYSEWMTLLFPIAFLAMTMMSYHLLYKSARDREKSVEIAVLTQKQSDTLSELTRANNMYDEIRVMRHEYKNNILAMKLLLESGELDKLGKHLDSYLKTDANALNAIDCGNRVLDRIFNIKQNDCQSRGIDFDVLASVPPELPFSESDLTSLLVNLIDNAIEASVKAAEPSVSVKLRTDRGFFFIAVFNTVKGDVLADNPDLKTTKRDKSSHGIGLRVIRSIADKYNGHVMFEQSGEVFKTSVMLEMAGF